MSNPESRFTYSISKLIDKDIYYWKIMATFNNGIPDCYFSGNKTDLWIEMKWINQLPKRKTTEIKANLSELQKYWLKERHAQGRKVAVVIGSPEGCVILPGINWQDMLTREDFTLSRKDVAEWIDEQVMLDET